MQNDLTPVLSQPAVRNEVEKPSLACSISLGEIDYFNLYIEQRVTQYVLQDELTANRRFQPFPTEG